MSPFGIGLPAESRAQPPKTQSGALALFAIATRLVWFVAAALSIVYTASPAFAKTRAKKENAVFSGAEGALARVASQEMALADAGCPSWQGASKAERVVLRAAAGALRNGIWPSPALRQLSHALSALDGQDVPAPTVPWGAAQRGLTEIDKFLGRFVAGWVDAAIADAMVADLERLRALTCAAERAAVEAIVQAEAAFLPAGEWLSSQEWAKRAALAVKAPKKWTQALQPVHPDYAALLAALPRYRHVADTGGWSSWPLDQRLRFEGWLGPADSGAAAIRSALTELQMAAGLDSSGELDGPTTSWLAVPASERTLQISLALERWRASGFQSGPVAIWVNLAAFETELWVKGQRDRRFRSVVGSPGDATPEVTRRVHSVQANPPWFVPKGVERGELEAMARKDSGFYHRNGFRFVGAGAGRRLVQAAGEGNWLGRAILRWDSRDAIFIHGSPFVERFSMGGRALSHGCVNVEAIEALGERLLQLTGGDAEAFRMSLAQGRNARFALPGGGVPAVLDYITVSADEGGRLRFHADVYGRDRAWLEARRAEVRTAARSAPRGSAPRDNAL